MIDIESHRIIDILDSREVKDVAAWLKTYPNLTVVSRDGSISYKSAIKEAGADIIQVSDRFHLLKGLTDGAKKYITSMIEANFSLPVSESHYDGIQTADYWIKETSEDVPTREQYPYMSSYC